MVEASALATGGSIGRVARGDVRRQRVVGANIRTPRLPLAKAAKVKTD
jgi:hypothetical protein